MCCALLFASYLHTQKRNLESEESLCASDIKPYIVTSEIFFKHPLLYSILFQGRLCHVETMPPAFLAPSHCYCAAESHQSCPTLCDPGDGSPPGSSDPGILQARTLEWVAISFSIEMRKKHKFQQRSRPWKFHSTSRAFLRLPFKIGHVRPHWVDVGVKTWRWRSKLWGRVHRQREQPEVGACLASRGMAGSPVWLVLGKWVGGE